MTLSFTALDVLASAPTFILLVICAIPPLHGPIRQLMHPKLRTATIQQLPWVAWAQQVRTPMLDVLVKACAVTVTVEFYLIGLPILYFLGYTKSTVILTTALAYCTLLTCVLKDICCGPRPAHMLLPDPAAPAPEDLKPTRKLLTHLKKGAIAVLETPRDVEYGAPSMHTSLALTMNLCCARLASHYVYAQAAAAGAAGAALGNPTGLGVVGTAWLVQQLGVQTAAHVVAGVLHGVALCWSAWIAWSRLYLGVHTPVDLGLGAVVGSSLVATLGGPMGRVWLDAILDLTPALWWQVAAAVWLLLAYPKPTGYTSSYQYAVTFLGAHTGFAAGISHAWRGCYIQRVMHSLVLNLLPVSALPTLHLLAEPPSPVWWVARCVMGLVAVLLTREVFTTVLKAVLPPLFEMVPAKIRTLYQPPINFGKLPAFHADGSPANDKENVPGMSGGTGQHMFADGTAAVAYISAVKGGEEGDGLRRRGGQASASVTAVAGGVIGADPHAVVDGKGRHVGGTVRADGVLLREDGKAWDADTVRRFVTYGAAVWSLAEYTWLLMAAGAS